MFPMNTVTSFKRVQEPYPRLFDIVRAQSLPKDCESSALNECRELKVSDAPCGGLSVAVLASDAHQAASLKFQAVRVHPGKDQSAKLDPQECPPIL